MGKVHMLKQLIKLDRACNRNPELEKEMEQYVPKNKTASDLTVSDIHTIISKYNELAPKYGLKKIK